MTFHDPMRKCDATRGPGTAALAPVNRRDFLRVSALAGGGLMLSLSWPDVVHAHGAPATFAPNAFIRIGSDDRITVVVGMSEMGQGVLTALPMLVAEELDADWSTVRFEQAPADPAYTNSLFGMQATGGSTSVRAFWEPLRRAGATTRAMLIAAAAQSWKVHAGECRAEKGSVIHPSGKQLRFGQLAGLAARQPVPASVVLKEPKDFTILGKTGFRRLDTPAKVNGTAGFGIDVQLPSMLTAVVARAPTIGGKAAGFQADTALAIPGVKKVFGIRSGIAVLAEGYWAAKKGRDALQVQWEAGPNATLSSESLRRQYVDAVAKPGVVARNDGDVAAALTMPRARALDVIYEVPYLAHACMEPLNCTAWVQADQIHIWGGVQSPGLIQIVLAQIHGIKPEKVYVETTLLGGGFGRRFALDVVLDAADISKAAALPVKLMLSREDDMRALHYRPAAYIQMRAAIDEEGKPLALHAHTACSSVMRAAQQPITGDLDPNTVEGIKEWPYDTPNVKVEWSPCETPVVVWYWRSVGNSTNIFFAESLVDEMAAKAGVDPFEYRRRHLGGAPRHKAVLECAADKAGWGKPTAPGVFRGIAVGASFGTYTAQVVEASVDKSGAVRLHRIVCAVDCGMVANPDIVQRQMESAIVFGLGAALWGRISIKDGKVEQSNFNAYRVPRINEVPPIEVHIVTSSQPPGGVGEPGLPCLAPALLNAIYAATGVRLRKLPIDTEALRRA